MDSYVHTVLPLFVFFKNILSIPVWPDSEFAEDMDDYFSQWARLKEITLTRGCGEPSILIQSDVEVRVCGHI